MGKQNISLVSYIRKYKTPVIFSALCNLGYSVFTIVSIPLLIPFFQLLFHINDASQRGNSSIERWISNLFNNIITSQGESKALLIVCVAFVTAITIRNVFRYLALYIMAPVRTGVVAHIRQSLFDKIFSLPYSYFTESHKGDMMSKAISDVQEVEWSILNAIEIIFKMPLLLIGSLILMFMISTHMTCIVIILIAVVVIVVRRVATGLRNASMCAQESLGRLHTFYEETIGGSRLLKSYDATEYQKKRFATENQKFTSISNKTLRTREFSAPLAEALGMAIVGILMYLGAVEVFADRLAPESFFAFLLAFYQVIEPAKALSTSYFNYQKGRAALDRIHGVIDIEDEFDKESYQPWTLAFNNELTISDLRFAYHSEGPMILDGINLSLYKGQKMAIVGASGSGKSTLAHLLCKYFSPTNGRISIDGRNINTIAPNLWRRAIAYISQDTILFHDSVKNNLTFGNAQITDNMLEDALRQANALSFVQSLSQGWNTHIGDGGIKLSGGQRQRLAIARAILYKAPIMLLDEATAALDTQTEQEVQSAIDGLKDQTLIVIAHRLSTIINADTIIVMDHGRIADTGTHHELMAKSEIYQQLLKRQII